MRSMPSGLKLCPGRATALSARRSWKKANWKRRATSAHFLQLSAKRRCDFTHLLLVFRRLDLVQVKCDFNIHLNRYRTPIFLGGIEFPDFYALKRLFIQAHTQ